MRFDSSKLRIKVALAAIVPMGLLAATAVTGTASVSKPYAVPIGDATTVGDCKGKTPGVGGVCFDVAGASGKVDISVTDQTGLPVGASYTFYDGKESKSFGAGYFCGSVKGLAYPGGAAVHLWVGVGVVNPDPNWDPTKVTQPAIACGQPSPGTTGTVTISGGSAAPSAASASSSKSFRPVVPAPSSGSTAVAERVEGVTARWRHPF